MTGGSSQPPPGWYPDPERPDNLRYWDGEIWTDHRSDANSPTGQGSLRSLGDWLSSSFRVAKDKVGNSLFLTLILGIPPQLAVGGALLWFLNPLQLTSGCDLNGFSWGRLIVLVVTILLSSLMGGVSMLAVSRQMHLGHEGLSESWSASLSHAILRLPRLVGTILMLTFAAIALVVVAVLLTTVSTGLGVIAFLLLIPLAIWAWVTLSFVAVTAAMAPAGMSVLKTTIGITKGRWWAVFGRFLVLTIIVLVGSTILGAITSPLSEPLTTAPAIESDNDGGFICSTTSFGELQPNFGPIIVSLLVTSIIQGLLSLPFIAGMVSIYLDSGSPTSLERPENQDPLLT